MRLIIAGGRNHPLTAEEVRRLDELLKNHDITEVVSGGCTGADLGGQLWAGVRQIPVREFPADWEKYGKAAGPIRNRQMAYYADAVALFPGGRGTQSMYEAALQAGIAIFDFRGEK